MMTGYSARKLRTKALEEGALDVMNKPVMLEDILGKLTEMSPGTILIVDDDPISTEMISSTLQTAGWNVRIAENGLMAVDITTRGGISAMVLDIEIPIMNSVEVCAELKRRRIEIPIIVASVSKYGKRSFEGYNVRGFMRKPIDRRVLLDFIEQTIRAKPNQAA